MRRKICISIGIIAICVIGYISLFKIIMPHYPERKVITNLTEEQQSILANELGISLPKGAFIRSASAYIGRDANLTICIEGIEDMSTFISDYSNMTVRINNKDTTYDSELRKAMIYNCDYYLGTAENRKYPNDEIIVGYELNNNFFVEISTDCFYEKETYKLFSFEKFYGGD